MTTMAKSGILSASKVAALVVGTYLCCATGVHGFHQPMMHGGHRTSTTTGTGTFGGGNRALHVLWSAPPKPQDVTSSSSSSSSSDRTQASESEHESSKSDHGAALGSPSRFQATTASSNGIAMGTTAPPAEKTESRTGRSVDEIRKELESGKVLTSPKAANGGGDIDVVDFSSVKNEQSNAEQALARAREVYMSTVQPEQPQHRDVEEGAPVPFFLSEKRESVELMGINEEVISEVGHPIGEFVQNERDIQDCAAWMRSEAASSGGVTFSPSQLAPEDTRPFLPTETAKFKTMVRQAYDESGEVTAAFAKTFYLGTQLMSEEAKRAIWAIYVWCRRTDEIVDAPRDNEEDMLLDLSAWEIRLERLWEYGEVVDVLDLPLLDVRIKFPNLPIQPFVDMVRGMLMDIPGLGQDRYDTFEELHLYCYRVAGTVGLMSMPVFGCASGFTEEEAKEPALSLGVAFQLTNILRDVGEDVSRGRVYLPQEDLRRFQVTEDQLFERRMDENYRNLMKFEIDRARRYYERAKRGIPMLAPSSRWPVQSSLDAYGQILDKIEENDYDSLTQRAYVSKWEKLCTLPLSWYRTQDIAKMLPLPGDELVETTR